MADLRVIAFSLYGPVSASHRVRLAQYKPGLEKLGISLEIQSVLDDAYLTHRFEGGYFPLSKLIESFFTRIKILFKSKKYDGIIVHCELLPLLPAWLEAFLLRTKYIYDFDDAWYLRYRTGRLRRFSPILGEKIDCTLARASHVTAGNIHLAEYARKLNPNVSVLPSVVDCTRFKSQKKENRQGFTVGWIGSSSTQIYLKLLEEPLTELQSGAQFVAVGGRAPKVKDIKIIETEWKYQHEVDLINTFDVGVMPLIDDDWCRGKCGFKLIQYMACGVPVIASRVGANIDIVTEDVGILVESSDEWKQAFKWMRDNPNERIKMGKLARSRVRDMYSLTRNLPKLAKIIRETFE